MRAKDLNVSAARATGNSGCDYLAIGTLAYATAWPGNTSTGWYAFVVGAAATVTAVTFKSRAGTTLTKTPTWLNVSLPAGSYVPAGFIAGEDAYISAITTSAGSILLYLD